MRQARMARIACTLLCASWPPGSAQAQELSEREFLAEYPTVISASRLRQNVFETPKAVTIIDQEMIKASGAREFAELFRLVPGFTVSYVTYLKGLQPVVNYHGLGREFFSRLQVLIDGRSMNNATLGGVDWSDFPLALVEIDRIEVIRGPSNATHGIGAFMATINVITKHASQERGGVASVSAGNDGIRDGVARFGDSFGGIDYRLTVGHRADDGFADIHDRRGRDFVSTRADWQIGAVDNLMFQAGGTDGSNATGIVGTSNPERAVQLTTSFAEIRWERSADADAGFFVQFYHYRFRLVDRIPTGTSGDSGGDRFSLDGGTAVRRSDLEIQQNFSTGANTRWVWGGSVREDVAKVPLIFSEAARLRVQRLFGHSEWRASDKVLVNVGAMVERNNLTGTDVAPQAAVNYTVTPLQVLRVNVSKALRTPTLIEREVRGIGLPDGAPLPLPGNLRPESIVSSEVSYVGEWPDAHATLDVKLFYDTVHDLIGLIGARTTSPAAAFPRNATNGDDARQRGVEVHVKWRPFPGTLVMATGTHLETRSDDLFDSYSTSAPRNTMHALASHRFADAWDASVAVQRQSGFRASALSDPQRSFTRVDMRVGKRLPRAGGKGEVAVVVENLFNNHYSEYRLDNVAQRRAWVMFSFAL